MDMAAIDGSLSQSGRESGLDVRGDEGSCEDVGSCSLLAAWVSWMTDTCSVSSVGLGQKSDLVILRVETGRSDPGLNGPKRHMPGLKASGLGLCQLPLN